MAREHGARVQMALAFETTYGTAPAGGWRQMPFASTTLGSEQPLLASELLGYGRDPLAPVKDAISVDGDVVVPVDAEGFGFWLKAAFGAPVTTHEKAKGHVLFAGNPGDGDTITLGGTIWTFVSGTPSGNETKIGGNVGATLTSLVSDLNGSGDAQIAKATYAKGTSPDALEIEFDTAGLEGNAFTIAASGADLTPSGPTLTGGAHRHSFASGSWALPSMAIETAMPSVPRYALYTGAMLDKLSWSMQRSGLLTASASLVAQGESIAATTAAGTPDPITLQRFGHFNGSIRRNGAPLGNIVSAEIAYANNLDRIETIRSDGRIDGADPGLATLTGRIEARFADTTLVAQAIAGEACELEFAYELPSGARLALTAHAVHLPRPRIEIAGPQGIRASFDWQAAKPAGAPGRMCSALLANDVASYA